MVSPRSLTGSGEFQTVYSEGRRVRRDGLTIFVRPTDADEASRLGLAIRGSEGTAVARNRLRRRLRSLFDAHVPPIGYEVVVNATRVAIAAPYQELEANFVATLRRAGVGGAER